MGTKHTKDNTYYSLVKGFTFSSWIIILVPLVLLIVNIIGFVKDQIGEGWYTTTTSVIAVIALVCAIIWCVLNIIMFIMAGNLRGVKSPFGIRFGLMLATCLVFAAEIIDILIYAGVIPSGARWVSILAIFLPAISLLGYIIGAALGTSIKRALR